MLRSIGKQSGVRGVSTEAGNEGYGGKDADRGCVTTTPMMCF